VPERVLKRTVNSQVLNLSSVRAWPGTVLILLVIALPCRAQQPDPVDLVKTAIANIQRDYVLSQSYTFQQLSEWTFYDKQQRPQRRQIRQFDVVFVSGEWYSRLTARDGHPLAGQEAEQEQRNWEQMLSGIRARLAADMKRDSMYNFTVESTEKFRTQVDREPVPFEDLPRLFELKLTGVEDERGRSAYVIEATPRPETVPANKWEETELHDRVKIWIDVAEQIPLRLRLEMLNDRRIVPKGSSFEMEWTKINNEFWFPTHDLLWLPKAHPYRFEMTASNFRKFDVTTRILAHAPPATPSTGPAISRTSSVPAQEEAIIRSVVQKGFEAYQRGDLPTLFSLFSENSPDLLRGKADIENNAAYYGKDKISDLKVDSVEMANDSATVRLSFESSSTQPGHSKARRFYTFQLARELGTWKLWGGDSDESEFASELLDAESDAERDRLLSAQPQLVGEELTDELVGRGNGLIGTGDYSEAAASFQLAYSIAERIGDKTAVWKALYGLGHGSLVRGNDAEANDYFRQSLALCRSLGNRSDLAFVLYQIGRNHADLGRYREAMQYYQQSLAIGPEAGKERLASTYEAIGDLFNLQGNREQALEQYRKSLRIFEELEAGVEIKLKVTDALGKIADVLTRQGNYKQALDYYQRNVKLLKELDVPMASAFILQRIGDNYALQGSIPEALQHYQQSLDLFQEREHKPGIATTLRRMAAAYSLQGDNDRALDNARQALDLARDLGDPEELSRIQTTLGRAYLATRQYDQAKATLTAAIAGIETLRTNVAGTERDQELFFEDQVSPYHMMVELLIQQRDFAQAFRFAELAKARVLYDMLRRGNANFNQNMTPSERNQERHLNQILVTLNAQLDEERMQRHPGKVLLHAIEAHLKKARLEYEAFETAVEAAHPELRVQRGESPAISLEDVADLMTDDSTAFLEYLVTKDRTYLFAILPKSSQESHGARLNVYPIEIAARDLTLRVAGFHDRLAAGSLDFRAQARQLYDLLLRPAHAGLADMKTICLVPSGPLWEFPFQALLSAPDRYVLQDHAVFYVPSLSVLRQMRSKEDAIEADATGSANNGSDATIGMSHTLLAVANPDLSRGSSGRNGNAENGFSPLQEQEQLVKTLGQIYGLHNSEILTGKAAREDTVKAEAGKYKVIHLATHGILDDDNPLYSGLLLGSGGKDEDGFLEAREIMRMQLHAQVAVLSACETARGKVHEGEGVIGLSWALFVAGTPTTVVSQWKIDSAGTAKLMIAFHRILKSVLSQRQPSMARNQAVLHPRAAYHLLRSRFPESELRISRAQALRQAALSLMADPRYAHPFYWAGFVMVGDGY